MRYIEFNQLKLKNIKDEELFYEYYLQTLPEVLDEDDKNEMPMKQYEIFELNILDGKIILLKTSYINSKEIDGQELFFDYSIALKVYYLMLEIDECEKAEEEEISELYIEEKIEKQKEIEKLKKIDEKLYKEAIEEYKIRVEKN